MGCEKIARLDRWTQKSLAFAYVDTYLGTAGETLPHNSPKGTAMVAIESGMSATLHFFYVLGAIVFLVGFIATFLKLRNLSR